MPQELSFGEILERQKRQWEAERQAEEADLTIQIEAAVADLLRTHNTAQAKRAGELVLRLITQIRSGNVSLPAQVDTAEPPAESQVDPEAGESLLGSGVLPDEIDISEGVTVTLGDVVRSAFQTSGLSVADWNAQDDDAREQRLLDAIDAIRAKTVADSAPSAHATPPSTPAPQAAIASDGTDLNSLTKAEIKARAKERFGIEVEGNKADMIAGYLAAEAAKGKE